jgi:hypothetical protein
MIPPILIQGILEVAIDQDKIDIQRSEAIRLVINRCKRILFYSPPMPALPSIADRLETSGIIVLGLGLLHSTDSFLR